MAEAYDAFYRTFEERYRGTRELIKQRLRAYLPFVEPLLSFYPGAPAIDLGCGRGEWLEVLAGAGFTATGVDSDDGMLKACTERGLRVEQGDAGSFLAALPDDSQAIVSAFHVVEHVDFEVVREWVRQANRVLRPGGLLILETPNPENILVATNSFYLDPTHKRPMPPELLAFVVEFCGFARVRTVRLQERPELRDEAKVALLDVFGGASPDYSIVAQKQGGDAIMQALDSAFSMPFGLQFAELSARYDRQLGATDERLLTLDERTEHLRGSFEALAQTRHAESMRAAKIEERWARIEERMQDLEDSASEWRQRTMAAEAAVQAQEQRIDELGRSAVYWQTQASELEAERDALRSSWSWRLSAPLRWAGGVAGTGLAALQRGANRLLAVTLEILRIPIGGLIRIVLRHPELSHRINQFLLRYPALYQPLVAIANRCGIYSIGQESATAASASKQGREGVGPGREARQAAPDVRARQALTGTDSDIDELLLRIEDEIAQWRSREGA